jgi:starch synthase
VKIVFVASEGVPYSKTGGLADVVGALPKALAELGHELEVVLPRYRMTKPGRVLPQFRSLTIPLSCGFKFASIQSSGNENGVRTYLVDCPEFFDREGLYQEKGEDYPDNGLRFAAFSLAALEFLKRSAKAPDIIHCHDWQTVLTPAYLHNLYSGDEFYRNTSVVLTIHNLGYQGLFPSDILPKISLPASLFTIDGFEFYGKVNYLKGGIIYSDYITTVSRKYAQEIQTPEFGHGLDGVLKTRADRLVGILNGVDYDEWNPATDKLIPAHYTPDNLKGKETCKKALLERMGIGSPVLSRPTLGIVSRFAAQKGFDLIAESAKALAALDLYIVALGTGEKPYEELFRTMASQYPDKFLVRVAYDNALAHQIEAGADMFLMPSHYEPCGLNQIYSMKYGTVPIVRATGGLDDTVEAFNGKSGTGFKFSEYSSRALMAATREALEVFRHPEQWHRLMQTCMAKDFSWPNSAKQYVEVYQELQRARAKTQAAGRT